MNKSVIQKPQVAAVRELTPRTAALLRIPETSNRPGSHWRGLVLTELLRRELCAGGLLSLLPSRDVARAQAELALPAGQALAELDLARARARLDVELFVTASCRRLEDLEGAALELVARVQDAHTGALLAHVHSVGPDDPAAITQAVAEALRRQLEKSAQGAQATGRRASLDARRRPLRRWRASAPARAKASS